MFTPDEPDDTQTQTADGDDIPAFGFTFQMGGAGTVTPPADDPAPALPVDTSTTTPE